VVAETPRESAQPASTPCRIVFDGYLRGAPLQATPGVVEPEAVVFSSGEREFNCEPRADAVCRFDVERPVGGCDSFAHAHEPESAIGYLR
jgi:hypothetical protein